MLSARCPLHITLRVRREIQSLRHRRFVAAFQASAREACERGEFRLCHYSIQRDHLHLVIEAVSKEALASGMKSIAARVARAVHRVFRRSGPVLFGRYHLRVLRTPREVRNALAYVLLNARKHWRQRYGVAPLVRLDVASSGAWFDGWIRPPPMPETPGARAVARPRGWLLRLHGLVDPAEVPGSSKLIQSITFDVECDRLGLGVVRRPNEPISAEGHGTGPAQLDRQLHLGHRRRRAARLYVRGKYRDVILPITVLRRLDVVLEPTKQAVLDMKASLDKAKIVHQDQALRQAAGQAFYNTSKFTLRDLKARASQAQLKADFEAYLDGFSPNVGTSSRTSSSATRSRGSRRPTRSGR